MSKRSPCTELGKKVRQLEKQIVGFQANDHALEECEDQFQALLNATTDSAILLDAKGTILANKQGRCRAAWHEGG